MIKTWVLSAVSLFTSLQVAAEPTPLDWVPLEGGCFQMGETRVYAEEAPRHEVCVDTFEITRTEITRAQFARFVAQTGYVTRAEKGWSASDPGGPGVNLPPGAAVFRPADGQPARNLNWWRWIEGASWRYPDGSDSNEPPKDFPVTHVTREDAMAYAAWAGSRLPTEAEWEYAARGGLDGALLAWPDAERDARQHKANTWQGLFPVADTADDGFAGLAPVASFPPNGFGLYDMIGNVWEWTATPHTPSHHVRDKQRAGNLGLDASQPGVAVGTIKGGSFLCARSYCFRFRPAARQAQDLAYGTSHIGFRIVRSIQRPAVEE